MRAAIALGLIAAFLPAVAGAQTDGTKPAGSRQGITKDQYVDQAKQRAAKRFDKLDANHDGVLSPEERRSASKKKSSPE